jgi:HlyD family secretion protein
VYVFLLLLYDSYNSDSFHLTYANLATMTFRIKPLQLIVATGVLLGIIFVIFGMRSSGAEKSKNISGTSAKSALTVVTTQPQASNLPLTISANGNVAAWQEAIIGAEANGLRLAEVRVNVGDIVKRGQVLATFAADTVQANLTQVRAAVAEAEATLAEATANADRARRLQPSGIMSAQQTSQYLTAESTAQARLEAQRANLQIQQLHLQQTQVLAPDQGVISARTATVGAVLSGGQELFRMIRQGRLEWRAEVSSADLTLLKPGMGVRLTANDIAINGTVRKISPTVDAQTRNGLVYVDLPAPGSIKAGMFARGEFEIGNSKGLTLPQSAVVLRDGFSYVLRVGPDSKVTETKVEVGRRVGDRIEITGGLDEAARVVASGGGFLADGDTVRVVEAVEIKPAGHSTTAKE